MTTTTEQPSVIAIPDTSFSMRGRELAAKPTPAAAPGALLQAITTIASDPTVDIEKIERLFCMHERLEKIQAEKEFNAAMSRAQAAILPIVRNKTNDHTRSTYADLAAINAAIVPIYTAEGLSVSFDTETKNDADPIPQGSVRTIAIVGHSGGFSRRHHMDLLPDDAGSQGKVNKTKVQASGSTNAYARRYLVTMIFNIATEDDDGNDGDGGGNGGDKDKDKGGKPELPTYTMEQVDANMPAWHKLVADKKKTADQIIIMVRSRFTLPLDIETAIRDKIKVPANQGEIE